MAHIFHMCHTITRMMLCGMQPYPAGSSHQKMCTCGHKGMDIVGNIREGRPWHLNNAQLVVRGPYHYTSTTTSRLNCRYKIRGIHAFMFFTQNSDPQDSSDHATFSSLLLSSFGEPVQIVASVSYSCGDFPLYRTFGGFSTVQYLVHGYFF